MTDSHSLLNHIQRDVNLIDLRLGILALIRMTCIFGKYYQLI